MPALTPEQIHQKLTARFGDAIGPLSPAAKESFFTVAAPRLLEVAKALKTDPELRCDYLQDLTATDHPKEGKLRVVYHVYSLTHRHMVVAKVELDRKSPVVDSVEPLWKAANWLEREAYDLLGVVFQGHPDLRRIMLPADWVGMPLRKDYIEAGGYREISNVRDNPMDILFAVDVAARPPPPPAPPAPPAPAPSAAPAAEPKKEA